MKTFTQYKQEREALDIAEAGNTSLASGVANATGGSGGWGNSAMRVGRAAIGSAMGALANPIAQVAGAGAMQGVRDIMARYKNADIRQFAQEVLRTPLPEDFVSNFSPKGLTHLANAVKAKYQQKPDAFRQPGYLEKVIASAAVSPMGASKTIAQNNVAGSPLTGQQLTI